MAYTTVAKSVTFVKYTDGTSSMKKEEASGVCSIYVHFTSADNTAIQAEMAAGGVAPPTDDGSVPPTPHQPQFP